MKTTLLIIVVSLALFWSAIFPGYNLEGTYFKYTIETKCSTNYIFYPEKNFIEKFFSKKHNGKVSIVTKDCVENYFNYEISGNRLSLINASGEKVEMLITEDGSIITPVGEILKKDYTFLLEIIIRFFWSMIGF
ncbi:hypothetical protein GW796_08935 [archaeon]|nr:hypothetical protein [archaeon]NCQ52003.1 hypothetical protein [archaeon]